VINKNVDNLPIIEEFSLVLASDMRQTSRAGHDPA
jgi:hypothetical protein